MPIKTTNLSYEEFYKKLLSLLILVEGNESKIYSDNADTPRITIGIGFNIEIDEWMKVILMYKAGILQYADLENNVYTLANVLGKQSQSMQNLINTSSKEIKKKIDEYRTQNKIQKSAHQTGKKPNQNMINLQKDINTILQNNIKIYNHNPENANKKLDTNKVFELTDDEAKEIKNIISFVNMKDLRSKLNQWNASYLTTFSKTESINPQELIPLLSIYYQSPTRFKKLENLHSIKDLLLLKKALKEKNRFLAWFSVRYYADVCRYYIHKETNTYYDRRIQEAAMFDLNNKDKNNAIEYFSTSINIFTYLNFSFKEANTKEGLNLQDKYTYLSFMQSYDQCIEINNTASTKLLAEYNQYHNKKEHYYSYVSNQEFANITQTLSPYLTYINTNFAKGSVSEYALENIYVLNEVKDTEQLNIALNQRKDTKSLTPLLIICLKPKTQAENTDTYTIKQSQNTFLSIVVFEGAKLDISKLNSDESEIIYARDDQEKIEAFLLQGSCQSMQHRNNTLTIQGNSNETYLFDKQPQADNAISPILKVYKEANEKGYIEIHNFAKETLADSTTYILGNDSRQRYSGITPFLNENTKPHNTDCSNEGNFKVIVQNLHLYGLKENEKLFLYNCENRKELLSTITSDYTALFYPVLDLPKQDEHSQRTQSSHIVLSTKEMAENANIQHQTTTANPNFQINRQAKLSQHYIITDAKLSTKKPPLQNKSKVLVQSVSFKDKKYIHYKANDTLTFQAHYNNTKLSQEQLKEAKANTKWAYILSTDEILPQKPNYRKITQEGSDNPYICEYYTLTLKKEYFDINKATYLHIFAYINTPSSKVKQVLKLEYPLSLRFNGKELHIVEWGKVKKDKSFKLHPLNLSNPKETIAESQHYKVKLENLPMTIKAQESYRLHITDRKNSNKATLTNHNTQNIINAEIFIDDDFCELINILQSYKNEYRVDDVRLEVGYNQISIEVARLKAFMYALRYGEGTLGAKGYKTIVGGGTFDDFSKHPNVYVKKLNSTAAGAYQFLSTTWNGIVSQYGKKYNINDFSPKNQDKGCLVLLYEIRESINLIIKNKIDEAIRSRTDKPKKRLHYEWASLPDSPYGQRTETMENFIKNYNKHLEEELQGISNLAISNDEVAKFID